MVSTWYAGEFDCQPLEQLLVVILGCRCSKDTVKDAVRSHDSQCIRQSECLSVAADDWFSGVRRHLFSLVVFKDVRLSKYCQSMCDLFIFPSAQI